MDLNKERLKNRLNVKFEPLKRGPGSVKRLQLPERFSKDLSKDKDKQTSILQTDRNRSTSHIRLPSLQKKTVISRKLEQKTEEPFNYNDMRQRVKSIRVLPTIKVQSREPINDTLTFLIKNQILTVPKIVAMLQKAKSDEFMYMRVKGIYEFQVCSEQQKGSSFITVSKNGMVTDGQLVPLQRLIYEYDLYTNLRKVSFFRHYFLIKFMNKWNRGSKIAKFVETKYKIQKLMFLENSRIISWKLNLKNTLFIKDKGGSIHSGWVDRVAGQIQQNKVIVEGKLLQFSIELLSKFELPLSINFDLMNKVLSSLINLNFTFQKKLRVERQLEIIYKIGRMLELHQQQSIAFYLLSHIGQLSTFFIESNDYYISNILKPLQDLDLKSSNYVQEKQKILLNATIKEGMNFKMMINDDDHITIQPTMAEIFSRLKKDVQEFITKIDKFDHKIIRVPNFNFVTNNVIKIHEIDEFTNTKSEFTLKEYIYSIGEYFQHMEELQLRTEQLDRTFQRKCKMVLPFFSIYQKYKEKLQNRLYEEYNYEQIKVECKQIDQHITFCHSKIHDGEYFILGYLSQLEVKEQIVMFLGQYKEIVMSGVPTKIRIQRQSFYDRIMDHLRIFRLVISTPQDYIKVHLQYEELEEKMLQYSEDLSQIERLQEIYLRIKKVELGSLTEQKGLMSELKIKVKNFKQTKENSYLLYRKELQQMKKDLEHHVGSINVEEEFYETTETPLLVYAKCHRYNEQLIKINKNLIELNNLQQFFNMKQTIVGKLNFLLLKFESLEEMWHIYKQFELERDELEKKRVMKIEANPLIKKYEMALRKVQKYSKDPDFYKIGHYLLEVMPPFLNSLYLVEDFHNEVLREQDFAQISQFLEKEFNIKTPVKECPLSTILSKKIYESRQQVLQISLKSHKEQEIQHLLQQFQNWWRSIRLEGDYLDEYPLVIIFNDNDQLRQQIQEYTTTLLNIINHKYGAFARKECNFHLRNINSLAELLSLAVIHQQKFLSLFPILTSKYAEKQLPTESKKFLSILQKSMKNVKWLIKPTENLNQNTKVLLNNHIKQFEAISKTISHFLEKKRVKFQRFYFLQDDELLEVLVGIGAENTIFRMFEGVKGWISDEEGVKKGVEGVGGESLRLRGWSYKQQEPEIIFKSLEEAIRTNLNSIVRQILHGYENQLKQLINLYEKTPWMCVYTVELILFTKQIEINCFQNNVDLTMQANLIQQNIAARVSDPLKNSNYITLQLFLLHYVDELKREQVNSIFDFKWYSFLRYYYEKDSVVMKAMGSEHAWGGEYQGLWNLMINTSDIRRAHTSILSNLKYGNGVLLQGPSGTGKTESLKELGRCMAKYCVIFNCSSEVNIRTLHKLLSGLCYTGSWLCLDEINRLTAEIMSVVANQINIIKNAVVQKRQVFSFMGKDMRLRHGVGIFSTMNPIYLKRAKLTENLKAYFRIISVNVPDYQKILQVLLYSLGIASSSQYSGKISKLFKNLSIQLSERPQYDFGLRAMKFFIYNLSTIRKKIKNQEDSIIEGLHQTFYSRLDEEDREVFVKVIHDTFGVKKNPHSTNFKVNIMKEAPQTGIIVLGPTSTKTTIIKEYLSLFDPQTLSTEIFNPNSVELKYFLGESLLGRWQQGVVEKVVKASFQNSHINYVLILDSKLKSQTIQNFNTLLDESKLLSLSNGSRLKIHNNFKMVMQTPDLQMTSPATITRCNVIYVSEQDVQKSQIISKAVPSLSSKEMQDKFTSILKEFKSSTILKIIKLAKIIFFRSIGHGEVLNESESIGFQKSMIFSIQLLGEADKIKEYLSKDNSVSHKKNPFNFWINFHKFKEGEFFQFDHGKQPLRHLGDLYIPTSRNMFYKYVNFRALEKHEHLLWKGEKMTGKTSGILMSFEEIFKMQNESKDIFKMTINPRYPSQKFTEMIEEKAGLKEQQDQEQQAGTQILIFVDDINLANEEMNEFLRYTIEYKKMVSLKNKIIYPLPKHVIIADASNEHEKEFTNRFCRHFAEINLPPCDENIIRHLYTTLIKNILVRTKTSSQFKASFELDIEKIVNFFFEYMKFNNAASQSSKIESTLSSMSIEQLGYCHMLPLITNMSVLNESNCKDFNELMAFVFSELRTQHVQHQSNQKRMDFIKLAYNQLFKHKFQNQYSRTLKSNSASPSECLQYTMFQRTAVEKIDNWQELKKIMEERIEEKYYVSQFILEEVLRVLRVLEWSGGHYYFVGESGVGKKTILKISSVLAGRDIIDSLPSEQRKIPDWYFSMIKTSFQKRKDQVVLIDIKKDNLSERVLTLLEQIQSNYPVQALFSSEYCDYSFNNAQHYDEIEYDRFSKPYVKVIQDFLSIAKRKIQLLFYSASSEVPEFTRCHHYLHKGTTYRWVKQFPSESVLEISSRILDQSNIEVQRQKINSILLKIYTELTQLMKSNQENNLFHFRYNPFYHFDFIKKFIENYKNILEKARKNEDILNRSVLKVHQISDVLEKIKNQIKAMEPKVKEKTQKLMEVVPVLEAKRKANEEVKTFVMSEKRDIQTKNAQIQEMMREVELKIKNSEPLIQEANESMLSLKRGELSELRNNPNAHPMITFTLENMVILMNEAESLDNIKKILSDPNLLSRLKTINPTESSVIKVQRRIADNPDWTFENVSKISYGIRYMVRWTKSLIKFFLMKKQLQGQRSKVQEYKRQLTRLQQKLSTKQGQLNRKQIQIKVIQNEYKYNKNELISLQELMTLNNKKYQNAELIKGHLQEEITNWHQKLDLFKTIKKNLAANAILITLYLNVSVALHFEEEDRINTNIKEYFARVILPFDPEFKVQDYIRDQIIKNTQLSGSSTKEEKQLGHPSINFDHLSIEDSHDQRIIQTVYHLGNRPLFIDPDNQVLSWLEKQLSSDSEQGSKLIIVKQSFISATKNVETALKEGHILIILIQDELDAFTTDILNAKIVQNSGKKLIDYNKNKFYVNPNFRLLLCNKSRNPRLSNKLYIDHPVLNFEITKNILKKMLLKVLIQLQNREIYNLQKQLQLQTKANGQIIAELQTQIIESLINSKKTLIDDNSFIFLLNKNQGRRAKLKESQTEWTLKNLIIKKILDVYENVAEEMSRIFMSLKYMSKINPLLTWNTDIFVKYFKLAANASISEPLIEEVEEEEIVGEVQSPKKNNYDFENYNIGLGNSRPTSALSYMSGLTDSQKGGPLGEERQDDFEDEHPTVSVQSFQNLIGHRETFVDQKLKGTMTLQRQKKLKRHLLQYLLPAFSEQQRIVWGMILCLMDYDLKQIKVLLDLKAKRKSIKQYQQAGELTQRIKNYLTRNIQKSQAALLQIFTSNPFRTLAEELSEIDILILAKLLIPNTFSSVCEILIKKKGYEQLLTYAETSTSNWFQRSDNIHPILLVMGQDPIHRISDFLTKKRYRNVILIPMGEGQNKLAEIALQKESRKENLVIIHNLHISENFISFLAKMLQQFQIRPPHKHFRLILISAKFEGLSQQITTFCHKYLIEQPMGIKNQIHYLRDQNTMSLVHPYHRKLSFVLTYLHSIINNLSKYKPYGWNLKYEFHSADFLSSLQKLKEIAESRLDLQPYECNIDVSEELGKVKIDEIDFAALRYMIGDIGYVGKLADDIDRVKMNLLIQQFVNPNIFQNRQDYEAIKTINFSRVDSNNQEKIIEDIPEEESTIFGLHPDVRPVSQNEQTILGKLTVAFRQKNEKSTLEHTFFDKTIPPVNHKFEYVNREIDKYNDVLQRCINGTVGQHAMVSLGNGILLSIITSTSRVFNLRAFSNPREFFISLKKDLAHKANVIYEKVELQWSLLPKENSIGIYGISNLKLQGATLNANKTSLEDGMEEQDVTLYVQAVIKKKERQNRKIVSIPIYLEQQRQGQINSYGDNTNLMVKAYLQANHPQSFWILRSTAFVVM